MDNGPQCFGTPEPGIGVSLMMRRKEAGEQMMYKKVEDYVKIHNMLEQKDKVIAGVSGGADSVCLLYVLLELKKKYICEIRRSMSITVSGKEPLMKMKPM